MRACTLKLLQPMLTRMALVSTVLVLTGCGALSIRETPDAGTGLAVDGLTLDGRLSDTTREVISMLGLEQACRPRDVACAQEVLDHAGTIRTGTRLLAASEILYRHALTGNAQARASAAWQCVRHSHRYLHAPDLPGRRSALDARTQLVLRLHNACTSLLVKQRRSDDEALRWDTDDRSFPRAFVERIDLATQVKMRGLRTRQIDDGIGVAAVAIGKTPRNVGSFPAQPFALAINVRYDTDASGKEILVVTDASRRHQVDTAFGPIPLARDVSAAYAMAAVQFEKELSPWGSLRRPADAPEISQVRLLSPIDPQKTPLLLIHGFGSSPATWANLANELLGDPDINEHYQVWLARYSTGLPILLNRRNLANSLQTFRANAFPEDPNRATVVVGHSMGGVLTRLLVTDPKDVLWNTVFTIAPETMTGSVEDLKATRELLLFQPVAGIDEVVFMAAPHGGTEKATGVAARFLRHLIAPPIASLNFLAHLLKSNPDTVQSPIRAGLERGGPTSLDTLSPQQPLLQAERELPVIPGVAVHSIIGIKNPAAPERGDGIVPLASARWPVGSEDLVESGHDLQSRAGTILVLKRILLERLKREEGTKTGAI
jgi:pimeloyl-ACP methyl ester carboxylesterase